MWVDFIKKNDDLNELLFSLHHLFNCLGAKWVFTPLAYSRCLSIVYWWFAADECSTRKVVFRVWCFNLSFNISLFVKSFRITILFIFRSVTVGEEAVDLEQSPTKSDTSCVNTPIKLWWLWLILSIRTEFVSCRETDISDIDFCWY